MVSGAYSSVHQIWKTKIINLNLKPYGAQQTPFGAQPASNPFSMAQPVGGMMSPPQMMQPQMGSPFGMPQQEKEIDF